MELGDSYDQTVKRIASEVLGIPVERLRSDLSMTDLKAADADYPLIFERSAEALGVELGPIIESMPVYTIKAGDTTMGSLRMLAAVSGKAAQLLDRYTVRPVDDTLGSIAAGLRTGKFVDSGRRRLAAHRPYSLVKFLAWLLLPLIVLVVVLPVGVAYLEYRQCCSSAIGGIGEYVRERAYRSNGPILFGGPFAAFILAGQLVPGLWALRSEAKVRRERRDI
jgi:hypothetical protein